MEHPALIISQSCAAVSFVNHLHEQQYGPLVLKQQLPGKPSSDSHVGYLGCGHKPQMTAEGFCHSIGEK